MDQDKNNDKKERLRKDIIKRTQTPEHLNGEDDVVPVVVEPNTRKSNVGEKNQGRGFSMIFLVKLKAKR
jgi:hypothetical protein